MLRVLLAVSAVAAAAHQVWAQADAEDARLRVHLATIEHDNQRAQCRVDVVTASGEERSGMGLLIAPGRVAVPWRLMDGAASATATLACCDTVAVTGVLGDDGGGGLVLLEAEIDESFSLEFGDLPEGGEELQVWTPPPIALEEVEGLVMKLPVHVLDVREVAGRGRLIRLDIESKLVRPGSVLIDDAGAVVGLACDGASNGKVYASPLDPLRTLQTNDPIPLKTYAQRQQASPFYRSLRLAYQASELRFAGEFAAAAERAGAALEADDANWFAWWVLGVARDMQGDLQGGLEALERAVAIEPAYGESQYSLGLVLLKSGDSEGAIEAFDRTLTLSADRPDAEAMKGVALLNLGRADEAFAPMRRAIELEPKRRAFYSNLLVACRRAEQADALLGLDTLAFEGLPEDLMLQLELGEALLFAGHNEAAIAPLRRAVGSEETFEQGSIHLALALGQCERFDEALTVLEALLNARPGHETALQVKRIVLREKRSAAR